MGILDAFKVEQFKNEIASLKAERDYLNALLTPEIRNATNIQQFVNDLQKQISHLENDINEKRNIIQQLDNSISQKNNEIVCLDDVILVQEFGLYEPQFSFASSPEYKEALFNIRAKQKELIRQQKAVTGNQNWTVNSSIAKGKKMVSDMQKLLLRAFNNECDELVNKVKYTNFDASLDKMYKSAESISKLGNMLDIRITTEYLASKSKEIRLAFEYQLKKEKEKEDLKIARALQREQAKEEKELAEQRKKLDKEQTHYQTAYDRIQQQISSDPENQELLQKQEEIRARLDDVEHALADVDYRSANMKAGYVYIISNIGAFGENVYKIGMTRRLEPMDRIDELGSASVPFNFDVHAMIFSDDAPALEAALHRAFENKKLNMVNHRREFFRVTLDEIKEVIKRNFDKTVEFTDVPNAEQYRVSMKLRGETETKATANSPEQMKNEDDSKIDIQQTNSISLEEHICNTFNKLQYVKIGNSYNFYFRSPDNIILKIVKYKDCDQLFIQQKDGIFERFYIDSIDDIENYKDMILSAINQKQ